MYEFFTLGVPKFLGKRYIKQLIMLKLALIISLFFAFSANANHIFAQKVNLSVQNKSLKDLFTLLKAQTDVDFLYTENQLQNSVPVSLEVKNGELKGVLSLIFKDQPLQYTINGNTVIVQKGLASAKKNAPLSPLSFLTTSVQRQVTGTVSDKNGESLPGVSVRVKNSDYGTVTDRNGKYVLTLQETKLVEGKALVQFSYIGFLSQEVVIENQNVLNITLEESFSDLEDVIVIGYGSVKKEDVTGSVSTIKPDEFNKGSQVNAQDALLGKVAGVNITSGSGAPGDGGTIRIRSGSSLSANNDPLIVIDGVPIDNSPIKGSSNVLGIINPADIESFTVLKDASSTAIYGSRASNGVIIITTKKGSANGQLRLNYNNNFSIGSITKKVDVLNAAEYRAFIAEHHASSPDVVAGVGTANTNWQNEIYQLSMGHEHNLSASGNVKQTPYRLSLGYNNQEGIIKTSDYERMTANASISPSFLDKHLTLNLNLKGSYEKNRDVDNEVVAGAVSFDPTRPVYADNPNDYGLGYFLWLSSGGNPLTIADSNPLADLNLRNSTAKIKRSIGNGSIDYKVHGLEDLRFNLNLGYDFLKSDGTELLPDRAPKTYVEYKKDGQGSDRTFIQEKKNQLLDFYVNYNKALGEHKLDAMAGYGWQHFSSKYNDSRLNHQGQELFAPTHYESEYYLLSYYGRLNYNYASKYMLTATLRADASSRFAPDNRWGYFPSAAFGWRLKEENFLKDVQVLSDLKLRLSYGQTGQQDIGSDYPYMATYTASYDNSRYLFGDQWYTTFRANGYDPNIKWETTETYNAGLDFGFVEGRISGSVDAYYRKTNDLLNRITMAAGSNLASEIYTNIGSMKNSGVEFALNTTPILKDDFSWDLNANVTFNRSEITKLNTIDSDTYGVMVGPVSGTGKTVQIHSVGYAPYSFYLAEQAYDGDGNAIENGYIQADGSVGSMDTYRHKVHSPTPSVYLGLSSRVTYKQWDLGFNAHASFGNYIYNFVAAQDYKGVVYETNTYRNILKSTRDNGFETQQLYSDHFLEKGDFFRMDNITLGYRFPQGDRKTQLSLSGAVQNVFVITGYSGLDPEVFFRSGDTSYVGIDKNLYPRPRTFMASLKLSF